MTPWEYEHCYTDVGEWGDSEIDDMLADRGSSGWELVSVIEQASEETGTHLHFFFKRPGPKVNP